MSCLWSLAGNLSTYALAAVPCQGYKEIQPLASVNIIPPFP